MQGTRGPRGCEIAVELHDELRKLQGIISALAAAPSEEAIVDVVADWLLSAVGADAGVLAVRQPDGNLGVRLAIGYGDIATPWVDIPVDSGMPLSEAFRLGEPIFLSSGRERMEAFPASAVVPVLYEGLVALPLVAGGRRLGALGLSFTVPRTFDERERSLLVTIAQLTAVTLDRFQLQRIEREQARAIRAAQADAAIDTARLQDEQLRARADAETRGERLSRLQAHTGHLSRAFSVEDVIRVIRDEPFPEMAVRSRGLWLLDEEQGGLRLVLPEPAPGAEPLVIPLEADVPAAEAARTCEPVWMAAPQDLNVEFPSLAGTGSRSAAAIPLAAEERVVGVLTIGFAHEQPPGDDERRFLVALADQGAVAFERARLYDSERRSRRRAELDRQRTLELARALQTSLLPPRLPEVPGLDLGARYHPALAGLEVGGDFYDVFDTGGDWAVVIGDVCGKGPEAAALTALARYTIRSVAMDLRHPAQVLRKLNDTLLHHQLDERFCTVAYGRVVPSVDGVRVSVCRGGHPPPLVVRRSGAVEAIGSDGGLIGLFPEIRLWEETTELHPGDSLVFYTDGVTEANQGREQFGDERLEELLRSCAGQTASELAENVEAAVIDFGGPEPRDDLAVLVLHVPAIVGSGTGAGAGSGLVDASVEHLAHHDPVGRDPVFPDLRLVETGPGLEDRERPLHP